MYLDSLGARGEGLHLRPAKVILLLLFALAGPLGAQDVSRQEALAAARSLDRASLEVLGPQALDPLAPPTLPESLNHPLARQALAARHALLVCHIGDVRCPWALTKALAVVQDPELKARLISLQRTKQAGGKVRPARLGVLLPLSGKYGPLGQAFLKGIRLAADAYPGLELVQRDTQGSDTIAATMVSELVETEQVLAILGPVGEKESLASAVRAQELGVPIILLTARDDITKVGPWVFRHGVTRKAQARSLARFAMSELQLRRFAVLYPKDSSGEGLMEAFWDEIEALGGEMRAVEGYPSHPKAEVLREPIEKLLSLFYLDALPPHLAKRIARGGRRSPGKTLAAEVDFDGLYIPDVAMEVRNILPLLATYGVEIKADPLIKPSRLAYRHGGKVPRLVQLMGSDGWNMPDLPQRGGRLVRNAVFVGILPPESVSEEARAFISAYEALYEQRPGPMAALGHDGVTLFALAQDRADLSGEGQEEEITLDSPRLERAEGPLAEVGDRRYRDMLRRALLSLRQVPLVTGVTSILPDGDIVKELSILTVDGLGRTVRERYSEDMERDMARDLTTSPLLEP